MRAGYHPTPPPTGHPVLDPAEAYDRLAPENPGDVETELAMAALLRTTMGAPETTDADIARLMDRADTWRDSPVPRDRLVQINQYTQDFYATRFPGSWAQQYLVERFGADLTGHPLVQPGYAPAGWTTLVQHLRAKGVTDTEMITAGVARVASTGRLIDQFRDRVTFPITNEPGEILGFVARRNPAAPDDGTAGPKYLNTGETPLFHKGDQFYGHLRPGTTPVIVEGPMDAIAVTLGSLGRYSGLAPLGTALTDQQAALLAGHTDVIIATDADLAGHIGAERDYWQLTPHGIDPRRATFPDGTDPADLLTTRGPTALASAPRRRRPDGPGDDHRTRQQPAAHPSHRPGRPDRRRPAAAALGHRLRHHRRPARRPAGHRARSTRPTHPHLEPGPPPDRGPHPDHHQRRPAPPRSREPRQPLDPTRRPATTHSQPHRPHRLAAAGPPPRRGGPPPPRRAANPDRHRPAGSSERH